MNGRATQPRGADSYGWDISPNGPFLGGSGAAGPRRPTGSRFKKFLKDSALRAASPYRTGTIPQTN